MIAHVRSKGWKRKRGGGKKHYQLCEQHPGQWRNVGINPQREEKKKGKEAASYGKKKAIHAHFQRKKEKGATSYGKSSKCAPLGGCTPRRKLQEEIARRFWVCPLDLLPGIVPSCDIHLLTFGEQSVLAWPLVWTLLGNDGLLCSLSWTESGALDYVFGSRCHTPRTSPWETLGPRHWTHWWVRN